MVRECSGDLTEKTLRGRRRICSSIEPYESFSGIVPGRTILENPPETKGCLSRGVAPQDRLIDLVHQLD